MSRLGLYRQIDAAVAQALAALSGRKPDALAAGGAVPAKDALHGDVTVNAAMVQARALGQTPRALAAGLAEALAKLDGVAGAAVAGGGFVNLTLTEAFLRAGLAEAALVPAPSEGRVAVVCAAQNPRLLWSAEAAQRLARELGYAAELCREAAAGDTAARLEGLVGEGARFGTATEAERAGLLRDIAQIAGALEGAEEVSFFAPRGGGFRPGLYEAVFAGAQLRTTALEPADVPEGLNDGQAQLARLYVLCHRGARALALKDKPFLQPEQENPAFLLHYAATKLAGFSASAADVALSGAARRLALHLAYFPEALALAHRLAEPQRLGLYLVEAARLLLAAQAEMRKRDEKTIAGALIAASEVVFSRGFVILGATPLEEIT